MLRARQNGGGKLRTAGGRGNGNGSPGGRGNSGGGSNEAWNPLDKGTGITLSGARNTVASQSVNTSMVRSSTSHAVGTRYNLEYLLGGADNTQTMGIANASASLTNYPGNDANGWGYSASGGAAFNNGFSVALASTAAVGDYVNCIMCADGSLLWYKNGRPLGLSHTGLSGLMFGAWGSNSNSVSVRTGTFDNIGPTYSMLGTASWDGNASGTFPTAWNSADKDADVTLQGDAMCASIVSTGTEIGAIRGFTGRSSGKYQFECMVQGSDAQHILGVGKSTATLSNYPGVDANGWGYYAFNGTKQNNGSGAAYGATWVAGDIIGVVVDFTAGTLVFYKNGVSQGTAYSSLSGTLYPMWGPGTSGSGTRRCHLNVGATAFVFPVSGADPWL